MLNEYLLKQLKPNKPIYLKYPICDCEHEGDISSAECEVRKAIAGNNGEIICSYWDGEDCGDAYVLCKIPYNLDFLDKLIDSGEFRFSCQ